jgi:hypothetical protein
MSVASGGGSSAAISLSSRLSIAKRPPAASTPSRMVSTSTPGTTMLPSRSRRKPPCGSGIGAPSAVPLASSDSSRPDASRRRATSACCATGKRSVTTSSRARSTPAPRASDPASATAAGRSLPLAGMISGDSAGSIAASVRASSDSGVTTCASPA